MPQSSFTPSPLTLGTVQLGMRYGVANVGGMPDEDAAAAILDLACASGVTTLDTARAYGLSEERIGRWRDGREGEAVRVVTKCPARPKTVDGAAFVRASLAASSDALRQRPLDLVLMHRAEDLLATETRGELDRALRDGRILAFGASVYAPDTALRLIREVPIAALQLPLSIVDRRFVDAGVIGRARDLGIRLFARSAFLQGALLMEPARLPPHLAVLAPCIEALREMAHAWDLGLSELALMAVRDIRGIDSVVVGVEHGAQLVPHVAAMRRPPLTEAQQAHLAALAMDLPAEVLDPGKWPRS
jgi:aryl-alcohol dehydrogenase-like predicted oxidoreductase